jgi:hypothetical protein
MRNQTNLSKLTLSVLSILTLVTISCGDAKSGAGDRTAGYIIPKTENFKATTKENTQAVPGSVMQSLESYDKKTGTYVFSKDADDIEDLKVGSVVLFETHSLRKIKSVTKKDGKIVVESEFAMLTDYFKDAQIDYKADINWGDPGAANSTKMIVGQPIATMINPINGINSGAAGQAGVNVNLNTTLKGWKIKLKLEPVAGSKLKIELSAKKENVCSIVAKGFISSFTSNLNISISDGVTRNFSYSNNGIDAEMEVKFSAVGLGSEIAILKIPAEIERKILINGVIPVTLRLKANLKIIPELAVGNSSQVGMKLSYTTNQGFTFDAGKLTPQGSVSGANPQQTGDNNTATMGIAGMGVTVEFPRFEVGIFDKLVVPYLVMSTTFSSYLNTGLLSATRPCHMARLKYKANAGVTMSLFGVLSINNDYKLFEHEKRWATANSFCDD